MFNWLKLIVTLSYLSGNLIFAQDNRPEKPYISYVTIDSISDNTIIYWNKSATPDISMYNVYSVDTTTYPVTGTLLGSVPGNTHSYIHNSVNMNHIYTITALKNGNESVLGGDYHQASELTIKYDSCSASMNLKWKPYIGWESDIAGYRVYEKSATTDFNEIFELNAAANEITRNNVEENQYYEFIVEAFNNQGIRSTSNRVSFYTYMPPPPSFVNIDYVSVIDNSTVEISISADISGEINDFQLTKSRSINSNFEPVTTINNLSSIPAIITDQIYTQNNKFIYRVEALNSCSKPVAYSNPGNNILLKDSLAPNNEVILFWNDYSAYVGGLKEYRIFRKNQFYEYVKVGTSNTTIFSETIDHLEYQDVNGELEYYIEAIEDNISNPKGFIGISKSNEVKVQIETEMVIPNAFNPNSYEEINREFIPIMDFVPEYFKMLIFDRSGKLLFRTNNSLEGWDGTMPQGGNAPAGVYIYHIEYQSHNGVMHTSRYGSVTLIY